MKFAVQQSVNVIFKVWTPHNERGEKLLLAKEQDPHFEGSRVSGAQGLKYHAWFAPVLLWDVKI